MRVSGRRNGRVDHAREKEDAGRSPDLVVALDVAVLPRHGADVVNDRVALLRVRECTERAASQRLVREDRVEGAGESWPAELTWRVLTRIELSVILLTTPPGPPTDTAPPGAGVAAPPAAPPPPPGWTTLPPGCCTGPLACCAGCLPRATLDWPAEGVARAALAAKGPDDEVEVGLPAPRLLLLLLERDGPGRPLMAGCASVSKLCR